MNDIIQFVKDLEEIKRVAEIMLSGNGLDVIDNTIQKYQRIMKNEKRNDWLCDNCLSENIQIFAEDNRQEMDCYCYACRHRNYIVSAWFARDRFKNEKRRSK